MPPLREKGCQPDCRVDVPWVLQHDSAVYRFGKIGAFEGESYEAKGLYRPEADCIIFTRDPVGFCRVCRRAIERVIDLYARP